MAGIPVHNPEEAATKVERIASQFRRQGCLLFDEHGRSMHPSECFAAAMESGDRVIVVVPVNESNAFLTSTLTIPKRKADGDLPHLRRKVFVDSNRISRFRVDGQLK